VGDSGQNRGRFGAEPWEICGGSVVHLGDFERIFSSVLGGFFSAVFDLHFGTLFHGLPFCVKRRPCLAKLRFGPLF
jgi:hypothetical protein